MTLSSTVHGVAVAVGDIGILIRGQSGAGKSSLAAAMIAQWPFERARLVADDRVRLSVHDNRLIARPHEAIAGQLELRGYGIQTVSSLEEVVLRGCIDLVDGPPERLPAQEKRTVLLLGVSLPLLELNKNQALYSRLVTVWPYFRDELLIV